jgi:hypothetical protein
MISNGWKINRLDIYNAFLNVTLHEEVYIQQLLGFVDLTLSSHVCRLHKYLYGLKQTHWAWHARLSEFLLSIEFCASNVDTSLIILFVGTDMFYLLVYVNNILLTRSN